MKEARQPLQIWGAQKTGGVKIEESQIDGTVLLLPHEVEIFRFYFVDVL